MDGTRAITIISAQVKTHADNSGPCQFFDFLISPLNVRRDRVNSASDST